MRKKKEATNGTVTQDRLQYIYRACKNSEYIGEPEIKEDGDFLVLFIDGKATDVKAAKA